MDIHKCGDCQKEFNSFENFLIHKLLVEKYKLTHDPSQRIPGLQLPKFIKVVPEIESNLKKQTLNGSNSSTSTLNGDTKKLPVENLIANAQEVPISLQSPDNDPSSSQPVDVPSDDNISICSQPESLRIDEGVPGKDVSSPSADGQPELEAGQNEEAFCKHCDRYYKNKVVLRVHEETVHSSNRPYTCKDCQLSFKTKGSLVRHLRTHTGERPFHCIECKKAFHDSGTLARHVHRLHRKKPFKQPSNVQVYITRIEPETKDSKVEDANSLNKEQRNGGCNS